MMMAMVMLMDYLIDSLIVSTRRMGIARVCVCVCARLER